MIGEELINTVTKKVSIDESKNIIIPNTQNNNIHGSSNNTPITNNKIPNNKLIDNNNQPQINNPPTNNHQEVTNNQPQTINQSTNNQLQINNQSTNNQPQINNSSTNNQPQINNPSTNNQESTNQTSTNQQLVSQKNNYLRFIPNLHNIIFFIICILIFVALYKYITYTKHDIEAELIKFNELNKHFNN